MIVAYRALGLGDFLTGVPALRALARAFPDDRRVLAAPAAIAPLAALSGAVDEVADTAPLAPPPPGADLVVNLHGRGPQSHRAILAARPRRMIAFGVRGAGEAAAVGGAREAAQGGASWTFEGPDWRPAEHEVVRWCRLLEESGIPADPGDLDLPAPRVPSARPGATVVHPGAASPARRWPPERWAAVARAEADAGRDVVVTGGAEERHLALAVAGAAGLREDAVLAGRTELMPLAALIHAADRLVCGDTGVAHLATAFRTPSVILFGPTPPSEWGPPPDRPRHRALWAGRRGDPHGREPDPGLLAITVDDVLAALAAVPARAAEGTTHI